MISISDWSKRSTLLKTNNVLIEYASALTRNLSIKLVVVIGSFNVTTKTNRSMLDAKMCDCFDKLTDFLTI